MAVTDRLGVPVGNESRAFGENSTPGSERRQGLFGFGHQLLQPCSRPRAAKHADHRRLARYRVLAGRFADQGRIAFEIEKIVRDLEGLADCRSITLERVTLGLGRGAENTARLAGEAQQRAGLHRLQRADLLLAELPRAATSAST